jgi:signal transduction histidine kinase
MKLAEDLAFGIVSIREMAQRERAEKALSEAKNQAEMYLDLMGHDINNMNQTGMGFLELALEKVRSEGTLSRKDIELLEKPMEAITNISRLITNIKKAQRDKQQKAPLTRINVAEVLAREKEQFSSVSGRKVTIISQVCEECWVMANDLLKDVFDNLIHNAIKHSSGPLTLGIKLDKVTINNKPYCRVEIEDNGSGISDERKAPLIEEACLRARRSGSGFGLCLVKTLVDEYHGTVSVEDRVPGEYQKGARFVVTLPAVE